MTATCQTVPRDSLKAAVCRFRQRAKQCHSAAKRYFCGMIALFIITFSVILFAEVIMGYVLEQAASEVRSLVEEEVTAEFQIPSKLDFNGIAFDHENETVIVVGNRGVILTSGTGVAQWRAAGFETRNDINGVAVSDTDGTAIAVGDEGLILVTDDVRKPWSRTFYISYENNINAVALDGNMAVVVGDDGMVLVSQDEGKTWDRVTVGHSMTDFRGVALSKDSKVIIAVGDEGLVCMSRNGWHNWKCDTVSETKKNGKHSDFFGVSVSDDGKSAVVVGENGLVLISWNVSASEDIGSWEQHSLPDKFKDIDINTVAMDDRGTFAVFGGDRRLLFGLKLNSHERKIDPYTIEMPRDVGYIKGIALNGDGTMGFAVGQNQAFSRLIISDKDDLTIEVDTAYRIAHAEIPVFETASEPFQRSPHEAVQDFLSVNEGFALQSNLFRVGAILVLLFGLQHLAALMRYNRRLAAYYDARADTIWLMEVETFPSLESVDEFERMMHTLSPDNLDFGRSPKTVIDTSFQLPPSRRTYSGGD